MTDDDIQRIPPYYRSQIQPAMTTAEPNCIRELIRDLTRLREDHADVARHDRKLIERCDTDELRPGREQVIELTQCRGVL